MMVRPREVPFHMLRASNRLLSTALSCAERGIPVRPAATLIPQGRRGLRRRWSCGCGDQQCADPGAHPIGSDWLTDTAAIEAVWQTAEAPNLLICSCDELALWRLPRVSGAYGMRLFEQQRPGPWPPLMKLPDGDWIVATRPLAEEQTLPTDVVCLAPGTPVVVPPSRLPTGRARWLQSPEFPRTPLPQAEAVLSLVALAEAQRLELLGHTG
jgi:hypothetical protein